MSATVGVEFGNGRHLTRPRWFNEPSLPPIMLEVGQQFAAPVGTEVAAISRATYAELKFGFKGKWSVGVRLIDFPVDGYGTDRDGYPLEYQQVASLPFVHYGRINTLQLVHSNTLFLDYYFPRKSGWIYVGAGGGWYRFEGLEDVPYQSGPNQPTLTVPGIPAADRAGAVLRIGHKIGFFRTGFDLSLTGAGVPDYLSFHLGFEPGLYISKE
jgi:hypothetical protein